jgi:CO/xanthine dehydrogenase FAD-binding subunit
LHREDNFITQARLAVSGISESPIRVEAAEAILAAQTLTPNLIDTVTAAVVSAADPDYSDYRGSAEYRRQIASVLTRRAVETAWQQERNE